MVRAAAKRPTTVKKARVKPGTHKDASELRRQQFVEAYIANGGNATAAAEEAGYSPGPSARVQGCRLLAQPNIAAEIGRRQAELAAKYRLTTEGVLKNLAQAVYFDPRKLFHADGRPKLPHELDDDTAAAINGLEVDVTGGKVTGVKFKAVERNQARDQAMKHLGLFKADNAQRSLLDGVSHDQLKAIAERLRGNA